MCGLRVDPFVSGYFLTGRDIGEESPDARSTAQGGEAKSPGSAAARNCGVSPDLSPDIR
jgi:hypothetical protein